jgi:hypothetical protein
VVDVLKSNADALDEDTGVLKELHCASERSGTFEPASDADDSFAVSTATIRSADRGARAFKQRCG